MKEKKNGTVAFGERVEKTGKPQRKGWDEKLREEKGKDGKGREYKKRDGRRKEDKEREGTGGR